MSTKTEPTIFANNGHKLVWGDALQVLDGAVADASVDLIFADPPYNIGKNFNGRRDKWPSDEAYLEWSYQWIEVCLRKLKPNGSFYFMCSTQCLPYFDLYLRQKLTVLSRIVWFYDSSGVQAKRYFGSLYEPILFCVRDPDNYTFNADAIKVEARTGAQRKLIDYRKSVPALYSSTKVPGTCGKFHASVTGCPSMRSIPPKSRSRCLSESSRPARISTTWCSIRSRERSRRALSRRNWGVGSSAEAEYVKVGLRRLNIATHFKGELLVKPLKSYDAGYSEKEMTPMLLDK